MIRIILFLLFIALSSLVFGQKGLSHKNKQGSNLRHDIDVPLLGVGYSLKFPLGEKGHIGPQFGLGGVKGMLVFENNDNILPVLGFEIGYIGLAINTYPTDKLTIEYSISIGLFMGVSSASGYLFGAESYNFNCAIFYGDKTQVGVRLGAGIDNNYWLLSSNFLVFRYSWGK